MKLVGGLFIKLWTFIRFFFYLCGNVLRVYHMIL